MRNPLLSPELRDLIAAGDRETLRAFCAATHPRNVAEFFAGLEETLTRSELGEIISMMSHDERADLFKRLAPRPQEAVLSAIAQAEREDIRRLSAYPEGTAGAVMTSDYAALAPDLTAREAIEKLRREAPDKETIYYAYVIDEARHLTGMVSLKDLILAAPERKVGDLMQSQVLLARADEDQETVAAKIADYDLLALPIVNAAGELVGIVTHDDAVDIIHEEHTEDVEKLMAVRGEHAASYLRTPVWVHFRGRAPWIIVLAALGLISGAIIHGFEHQLVNLLILALYMPMLADTGGNTGSQSATVVIRALAVREISARDLAAVLWKELRVSALLAGVLAALALGKVLLLSRGEVLPGDLTLPTVAVMISLALGLQVITATVLGAALPLFAARLRLDPAVVASPALTTVVDITGLLIYFGTAHLLLGV